MENVKVECHGLPSEKYRQWCQSNGHAENSMVHWKPTRVPDFVSKKIDNKPLGEAAEGQVDMEVDPQYEVKIEYADDEVNKWDIRIKNAKSDLQDFMDKGEVSARGSNEAAIKAEKYFSLDELQAEMKIKVKERLENTLEGYETNAKKS